MTPLSPIVNLVGALWFVCADALEARWGLVPKSRSPKVQRWGARFALGLVRSFVLAVVVYESQVEGFQGGLELGALVAVGLLGPFLWASGATPQAGPRRFSRSKRLAFNVATHAIVAGFLASFDVWR